jgi:hypothetical protein
MIDAGYSILDAGYWMLERNGIRFKVEGIR